MSYLLLLLSIYVSADALKAPAKEQKENMDYPTYGEPIYAHGVKTNLMMGRQWQQILFENFESGVFPGTWTVVDGNSDGFMWQIEQTSTWHTDAMPGDSEQYIVAYDDDAIGSNPATEEELIPPAFNVTMYDSVSFIYSFGYQNLAGDDTFAVRVRIHDGASWGAWNNLVLYDIDMGSGLWDTLNLTPYLPAVSMQVELDWWDHNASHWDWYVAVDNVELSGHLAGGGMHDVGVIALNSPPHLMVLDSSYPVISTFRNLGDSNMTFSVLTEITDTTGITTYFQYDSANIFLESDSTLEVNFGSWAMTTADEYIYRTYITTPDSSSTNDTLQKVLRTDIDVGMVSINSPVSDQLIGSSVDVNGTVTNYGINTHSFFVRANVYDPALSLVFTNTKPIPDLAPGDTSNIPFGNVNLTMLGEYTVEMFTYNSGDMDSGNDTLTTTFNVGREVWASLPDAPGKRLAHATVYDPDDDLFFIIGGDSTGSLTLTNTCFEFDPSTETWTVKAPMDTARNWIDGAYRNGYIHIAGGYDGVTGLTLHEVYDIAMNSWSTAAPIPYPAGRIANGLVTWNDSLVYLIGGRDIGTNVSQTTVDFYEPISNTWISASPITVGFDMGGAKIDGNTIYIIGGLEAGTGYIYEMVLTGDINPYDPTQINWHWEDFLPTPNMNNGLAIKDGKAYMIGGFLNGTIGTNEVQEYTTSSGSWEAITPYPFIVARNNFAERRDAPDSLGMIYSFMGDEGGNWNPTDKCFKFMRSEVVATDTLYGNVDAFNTPYDEGSIVTAISGPYVYIDTTDLDGNYMIPNLFDGAYDVTVSRAGYVDSVILSVNITGNLQLDFGLYPYDIVYEEDFEADSGNYSPTGDWQWGIPTYGTASAHSGVNLWATRLDTNYSISSNSQLTTVPIDLSGVNAPILSFYHWYDIEGYYDGGNIKISVNSGPWQILDALDPPYNEDAASTANAGIPGEPCYSGNVQGFWEEVTRDLSDYEDSIITLMFHFGSDGSVQYPGWYIDDVAIFYKDTTAGISFDETPSVYLLVTPAITKWNQFQIRYSLPEKSRVSIKIYDCTGREVKDLTFVKDAGWYHERIDMNNRPTGIYFIKMKAVEFTQTNKTILIR